MGNKPAITTSMIKTVSARPEKRPVKPAITTGTVQPPLPVPRALGLPRDVMITTADVEAMRDGGRSEYAKAYAQKIDEAFAKDLAPEVTPEVEAVPDEVEVVPEVTPKRRVSRKVKKD